MKILQNIYSFFNGTPWLNITFFFLAVLGIVLSFILYRKSKKDRKPYYNLANIPLIEESIFTLKNLSLDFQGESYAASHSAPYRFGTGVARGHKKSTWKNPGAFLFILFLEFDLLATPQPSTMLYLPLSL